MAVTANGELAPFDIPRGAAGAVTWLRKAIVTAPVMLRDDPTTMDDEQRG